MGPQVEPEPHPRLQLREPASPFSRQRIGIAGSWTVDNGDIQIAGWAGMSADAAAKQDQPLYHGCAFRPLAEDLDIVSNIPILKRVRHFDLDAPKLQCPDSTRRRLKRAVARSAAAPC